MDKSIYSLVLSDSVVEAVDDLARAAGLSRSAMVNQLLAERVCCITPEMRLRQLLESVQRSMNEAFYLMEQPSAGTLSCRSALKYRYNPTVRYSVELYSKGGSAGEMKVYFRTQNVRLISDLTGFFTCWAALEQQYISTKLSQDIIYTIENGRFTRTLNMPKESVTLEQIGQAVADYMAMFDAALKEYFAYLPDIASAEAAVEKSYSSTVQKQKIIV